MIHLVSYIITVVKEGVKLQHTDNLGKRKPNKFFFSFWQYAIISIAIITSLPAFLWSYTDLINDLVTIYAIMFAVLIGLFVMFYDKIVTNFRSTDLKTQNKAQLNYLSKRLNFSKRFLTLCLFAILIAFMSIVCLIISKVTTDSHWSVFNYQFTTLNSNSILIALKNGWTAFIRIISLYFLLDFILLILYLIGSMGVFMLDDLTKTINKVDKIRKK